jgi:hypothetical protein
VRKGKGREGMRKREWKGGREGGGEGMYHDGVALVECAVDEDHVDRHAQPLHLLHFQDRALHRLHVPGREGGREKGREGGEKLPQGRDRGGTIPWNV